MRNLHEHMARLAGLPVTEQVRARDRLRNEILEDADQAPAAPLTESQIQEFALARAGIKTTSQPEES